MPYTAVAKLKSRGAYVQNRFYDVPRNPKEDWRDYEERIWKFKAHTTDDGHVMIPPFCFKPCIVAAVRFVDKKEFPVPNSPKGTWTAYFKAGGLLFPEGVELPYTPDDAEKFVLLVQQGQQKSSGVVKYWPLFKQWEGDLNMVVGDDTIYPATLEAHLRAAGAFVGIGSFRLGNGGTFGGFEVMSFKTQKI